MKDKPAFPGIAHDHPHYPSGLTKREYFAVHAPPPPGFWVPHWIEAHGGRAVPVDHATAMASWAETYADALLAALGEDYQ